MSLSQPHGAFYQVATFSSDSLCWSFAVALLASCASSSIGSDDEDSNNEATSTVDTDEDGIVDSLDNCPFAPNESQLDTDDDNQGDACSDDWDSDGYGDSLDNCQFVPNAAQADGDGIGNLCDNC